MARFQAVGANIALSVPAKGESVDIAQSGTYVLTTQLQREQGSPGSGSWEVLQTWDTDSATVAYTHVTENVNESLRLICTAFTSEAQHLGTMTSTSNLVTSTVSDQLGNTTLQISQTDTAITGGLRHLGTSGSVAAYTASFSATAAANAGKVTICTAAAGMTVTLPAATGTGDVYEFMLGAAITSNDYIFQVANATDSMLGFVSNLGAETDGKDGFMAAANDDTVTLDGSTGGGELGDVISFTDVGAGLFLCKGFLAMSGTEATPFSAAVS